jgi:hypothetical protein
MNSVDIKLYDIFRKDLNLTESKAKELVQAIDEAVRVGHEDNVQGVATKEFMKDEIHRLEIKLEQTKGEVTKAIFWANLIQFLAIVGSVIGIISFMMRK